MTKEELKAHLEAMHDRVINFPKYDFYKTIEYRDRCQTNFGSTGNFVINSTKGNFYGNTPPFKRY